MKTKIYPIFLAVLSLVLFSKNCYSINEHFRSINNGNWDQTTTWEMSTNGGASFVTATITPTQTSGPVTVRSPNTVTISADVSADQLTVNTGATLTINSTITFTLLDGAGTDFTLASGATVSASGIFQTQGLSVSMNLNGTSSFNAPLNVNTGTTTVNDLVSPNIGRLFGKVTVDIGAILTPGTSTFTLEVHDTVTNNGTIAGSGGAIFALVEANLINNSSISVPVFRIDSVSFISGSGTFTSPAILISSSGEASLLSDVTFSPVTTFTINNGGILNPNTRTFTINTGTSVFQTGSTVLNSGIFRTQGTVALNLRAGSNFAAPLKVNTGTTTANDQVGPFVGRLFGTITVDNGATLSVGTSTFILEAHDSVTNNGTIAGTNNATFALVESSLINNSSITTHNFRMDSTCILSGAGSFTSVTIAISSSGNVSLSSNVTFSPISTFTINNGGVLNPNTQTFTFNAGTCVVVNGGTVANSGIFRTQGTVALNLRSGSSFNAPLKVNTGTTTANDQISPFIGRLFGTVTVDNGATLSVGNSSFTLEAYDTVTNNGIIGGFNNATTFVLRSSNLINNNSLTTALFRMDSVSALSGNGTFTGTTISISSSANISLSNDITFSPTSTFTINTGGILNLNTRTFTQSSGTLVLSSGATVSNSGIYRTQGAIILNLRAGSSFNAPLKVNTGTTTAYDQTTPFVGKLFGTITVDSGAVLSAGTSISILEANNNVTNNGTIAGNPGATFRFLGTTMINNGTISTHVFNFQSGAHTLQGIGRWTTPANLLTGANVSLLGDHQMSSVNINNGATFDITNFTSKFTASNPITQNGTFINPNSTVEYNGITQQIISTTNIIYDGLRINDSAGTFLANNVTVNDTLSVVKGDLELNGKILTISPTGYLTETPGNTVKGTVGHIVTTRNIGTPNALNVGGFGAVLTATTNLGITEIKRGHTVQTGLNGGTSIRRYYDITPTNNTGLNANFVFKFDDSELNGKPKPSLKLFKSTNSGSTWVLMGGTVNIATNEITVSGITSFSRWTADSTGVSAAIGMIQEGFYNAAANNLNKTDSVRAYLRKTTNPYAVVDSAIGLLDSLTFKSALEFPNTPSGTYYIQLKHRNSLETWSKTGVIYTQDSTLNFDFTIAAAQAFGNNMILKGTKYCLYSGDVTQDGSIDLSDVILINNNATSFVTGYVNTDANGNSIVDLTDVIIAYNNSINFIVKKSPLNP